MADEDLDDLEEELAELEEELGEIEDEPDETPDEESEGLVDRVRGGLPLGDEDDEAAAAAQDEPPEPDEAAEAAPPEPEPSPQPQDEADAEADAPWDREGGSWTAEGEAAADDTVIVRRLDADGNVVEEERTSREAAPAAGAGAGAPPPDPDPAPPPDPDDEDDDGRGWLVLLIVGIVILGVVGAGVAYVTLGGDDGTDLGGTDGPTAAFSRTPGGTVTTGTQVTFDASDTSIPDGADAEYEWSLGDGTTATGERVTHTYSTAGTQEVTLTVTANGQQSSATKAVEVVQAPEAKIEVTVNGSAPGTDNPILNGTEITLSGASSTGDSPITSYEWNVDGDAATGSEVTASFVDPGAHPVQLTVQTSEGFTDSSIINVGVGYETRFSDTLPAAVDAASAGPPHNFTVGHDGLTPDLVEGTLNYTTGDGGPLQDPTPARLNVTDAVDQVVATETGSDGLATVSITDAGSFVPGTWTAQAEQDQGGAQKSYTLTLRVVYPTG